LANSFDRCFHHAGTSFPVLFITAGFCPNAGWMPHEHEIAFGRHLAEFLRPKAASTFPQEFQQVTARRRHQGLLGLRGLDNPSQLDMAKYNFRFDCVSAHYNREPSSF